MDTITLHVKGSIDDTRAALAKRSLVALSPIATRAPFVGSPDDLLSSTTVDAAHSLIVSRWFAESPELEPGFRFPAGTLLHFSYNATGNGASRSEST